MRYADCQGADPYRVRIKPKDFFPTKNDGVNRNDRIKHQALYAYRLEFAFENSDGELGYLHGKSVEIDPDGIDFVKWFGGFK